jgi:hypothetical protein
MTAIAKSLFNISLKECSFSRRGFWSGNAASRMHLESVGESFLTGYNLALEGGDQHALAERLNTLSVELRGFAFEGAAMAMTILDSLMPWRRSRVLQFLNGVAWRHRYMVHVGMGWAVARLPKWMRVKTGNDDLLRWLVLDGFGFHEGYFKTRQFCGTEIPKASKLSGYAARAFDQGLGRSLWFVHGTNVERIHQNIQRFHPSRRPDLWSGVGLACTYAGGCGKATVIQLKNLASDFAAELAQGAAFAATTRLEAGLLVPHTVLACSILCNSSVERAAQETELALQRLPAKAEFEPRYEIWRRGIREAMAFPITRSPDHQITRSTDPLTSLKEQEINV